MTTTPAPTQFERVLLRLRGMIVGGECPPNTKLLEVEIARLLDVSRTPVRLAMQALAQEGLLLYTPQRGFVVRGFTIAEVIEAVDIRGRLEAMACEMAAARGLTPEAAAAIERNLEATRALLGKGGFTEADGEAWSALNGDFHDLLVAASGSTLINGMIQQAGTVPLSSARMIVSTPQTLDVIHDYVSGAVVMHAIVFDAVRQRNASRARLMMEEHVFQGRERLRLLLEDFPRRDMAPAFRLVGGG